MLAMALIHCVYPVGVDRSQGAEPITQAPIHADSVLVVGAGPTGLVCALFLVRAGIPVTVLERATGLPEDMRASTFHPATLDLLTGTGVARTLLAQGTRIPRWQYLRHGRNDRIVFDLSLLADATQHPYRLQAEQFRLTNAIVERLRDDPLFRLRRGARLTAVEQDEGFVHVVVEERSEARREKVRWLIAADGGHSAVRASLGLSLAGDAPPRTTVGLVLDYPFQEHHDHLLGVNYFWAEDTLYSLMRVRDLWRFSFSPGVDADPLEARDAEAAQARLQQVFPRDRAYRIIQLNPYTVHPGCLERFRHGRVLFCGDSAHLASPAGGMGMNSGIHDAACLVQHLVPVLKGEEGSEHLDRYDRRRRTITVEDVQRLSSRLHRWHQERDPDRRSANWASLRSISEDPDRCREFLRETSMLRSRERESTIE